MGIIESYFPKYQNYQPGELVKMFEESITKELNFKNEASNLVEFQLMFQDNPDVHIPRLYKELCTDNVLCMEFVDGCKITDLEALERNNISRVELARKGIGLYFEQVFEHGFFHADPHLGNIFVLTDGRIAFLDYGMMGVVIEKDKVLFAEMLLAMYNQDIQGMKRAILQFTDHLSEESQRDLEYDIVYFLRKYSRLAIEDMDGNEIMKGFNSLFFEYKIKIPSNLLLLLKALIIIEGVGLKLDPQYNIINNIGPYVKQLLTRKYNTQNLTKEAVRSLEDTVSLAQELPQDIREILHKIKQGKLHIEMEHKGLRPFGKVLSRSINRLSYALIIAALIIGSSLITLAGIPPLYFQIPIIGAIGFGISLFMIFRLLRSLSNSKNNSLKYD